MKTQAVGAGIQTAIAKSPLDRRTQVSPAAAARPAMVKKSETAATPQSTALSAPAKAPQIARDEAIAVPQAHPNTVKQQEVSLVTAEPIREPALKVATSLATAQAASPGVPAVQGPSPTEIPAPGRNTPPKEQVGASPASGATADAPTSKPELSLTVGSFAIPRPTSADPPPQPQAYPAEEDAAFKEGQVSTCVKNVSLGSMEKEKLFLAIPDWALNCYRRIRSGFLEVGFSDSLMPGARNYLIVFNTAAAHVAGNELTKASAVGEATPAVGSFYDQLWLYVALQLRTVSDDNDSVRFSGKSAAQSARRTSLRDGILRPGDFPSLVIRPDLRPNGTRKYPQRLGKVTETFPSFKIWWDCLVGWWKISPSSERSVRPSPTNHGPVLKLTFCTDDSGGLEP